MLKLTTNTILRFNASGSKSRYCFAISYIACNINTTLQKFQLSFYEFTVSRQFRRYAAVFRPPDILVGGLRFYREWFCLLFSIFVSYPPISLNGTQPKPATCSEVTVLWKCMSEIWGIRFLCKSRAPKPLFQRFRNLTPALTSYLWNEHNIHNQQVCWKLSGHSYIASQCNELWSTNGLKLDLHFTHPPKILHSTSLPGFTYIRESANGTQPNFQKRLTVNRANNLR